MTPIRGRSAYTVVELVVALSVIAIMILLVVQVATWSMLERMRLAARRAALEQAANVLEAARAVPAAALTGDWVAAHQALPADTALPSDSRVQIDIAPEGGMPAARRMTVRVRWRFHEDDAEHVLELASVFGPRSQTGAEP